MNEPGEGRPLERIDDDDFRLQAGFRCAIRWFERFAEERARAAGITPQQHMLLLTVRGHPDYPAVPVKEIAERLQIRQHSASLLVERGVKRGLLVRTPDPADRRRVLISLTDEGTGVLEAITRAIRRELPALGNQWLDIPRVVPRGH